MTALLCDGKCAGTTTDLWHLQRMLCIAYDSVIETQEPRQHIQQNEK
jgi:hypothetical protein